MIPRHGTFSVVYAYVCIPVVKQKVSEIGRHYAPRTRMSIDAKVKITKRERSRASPAYLYKTSFLTAVLFRKAAAMAAESEACFADLLKTFKCADIIYIGIGNVKAIACVDYFPSSVFAVKIHFAHSFLFSVPILQKRVYNKQYLRKKTRFSSQITPVFRH